MKRSIYIFFIFFILCLVSNAIAAPQIGSVEGTFVYNGSVTLSGTNFGTKSPAAPWLFDDFESTTAADGDSLLNRSPKVGTASWKHFNFGGGLGDPCEYDSSQAYSGTFSAYQFDNDDDGTDGTYEQTIYVDGQATTKRYISYHFRTSGVTVGTWKIDRTTSGDPGGKPPYDASPGYGWGICTYYNDCEAFQAVAGEDGKKCWINAPPSQDTWHRIENYYEISTPDEADGSFVLWIDNKVAESSSGVRQYRMDDLMTATSSCSYPQIDTWMTPIISSNRGDVYTWIDDVYIDNTLARVEIGDNAVFTSCTHRQIQIPTSWSSSSITATVNQGSFKNGDSAYLFVVDGDGNASNGYPITIGNAPPSPPSGLQVVD
jgi:hypothetical protein